ncbi:unnamed protein product, partial [Choristocarpus tenellus]
QAKALIRRVSIHFFAEDDTLEIIESKDTATPGLGKTLALRRPSPVPLTALRVGEQVMINGAQIRIYDADCYTRESIPGLLPAETVPDRERGPYFSVISLHSPMLEYMQGSSTSLGLEFGCSSPSDSNMSSSNYWDAASGVGSMRADLGGTIEQEVPGTLRFFCRWDDTASDLGTIHMYILLFFLEDGTLEMRELVDTGGGHHFQSPCPVMLRRQRVLKEGVNSLSVDHIGGDLAFQKGRNGTGAGMTPGRWMGGGSEGFERSIPISLCDLKVGKSVCLMNRPITICGCDEATHTWLEAATGMNMRGLQQNLDEFRNRLSQSHTRPFPPNKTKSAFFDSPSHPLGCARARFLKASENIGKTLRFMCKATKETQTQSTRESFFIIRFYPEDDTLSVSSLGGNAGGVDHGVYMTRCFGLINPDTGKAFHPTDFGVGSVVHFPTISLEV